MELRLQQLDHVFQDLSGSADAQTRELALRERREPAFDAGGQWGGAIEQLDAAHAKAGALQLVRILRNAREVPGIAACARDIDAAARQRFADCGSDARDVPLSAHLRDE